MSNLQKLLDRLKWVQEAKLRLSAQQNPQDPNTLLTLKAVMLEHLELEKEFLNDAIKDEVDHA